MQNDQSLYLDSSNINKEELETQHRLGITCSKKATDRVMTVSAEQHHKQLQDVFKVSLLVQRKMNSSLF